MSITLPKNNDQNKDKIESILYLGVLFFVRLYTKMQEKLTCILTD
jgi:hypothetical protein